MEYISTIKFKKLKRNAKYPYNSNDYEYVTERYIHSDSDIKLMESMSNINLTNITAAKN